MLQLLKEAAPGVVRVAVLFNSKSLGAPRSGAVSARAALGLGLQLENFDVARTQDLSRHLKRIAAHKPDALCVMDDSVTGARLGDVAAFAQRHKLASIGASRQFVEDGGMLYYGADPVNLVERTVGQADRVLKGEKPSNLPVEQTTRYELVVNLKTASTIGRAVPKPGDHDP